MDSEPRPGVNEETKTSQVRPPEEEVKKSRRSYLQRARDLLERRRQAANLAKTTGSRSAESPGRVRSASVEVYKAVKKNLVEEVTQTVRSLREPGNQSYDAIRKHELQNPTPDKDPTDSNAESYSVVKDVTENVVNAVKRKAAASEFLNPDRSKLTTPDLGKHIAQRNQTPVWENHILDKKDINSPLVQIKNLASKIFPFQKIGEFGKSLFSRKDQTPPSTQKPSEPTPTNQQPAT